MIVGTTYVDHNHANMFQITAWDYSIFCTHVQVLFLQFVHPCLSPVCLAVTHCVFLRRPSQALSIICQ